jgi:carboxypeptidase C (cathepsin A)
MHRFSIALRFGAAFAVLLACSVPALYASAAEPAPGATHGATATPKPESSESSEVVTHHSAQIDGRSIAYTATAGTITLRDADANPAASMFYVAYTEDGADLHRRPVTFFYNGGPGSSTIWLHMGSFAPKRVAVGNPGSIPAAPYKLVDNEYSLLDRSDLVFIDAPATGFSKLLGKSKGKDFFGIDQDAAAFGQFIERFLTKHSRWNSPKFLFGESYGTTRSCALAAWLETHDIDVNGVVLLSSALNFLQFAGGDGNDMPYITYVPTEAAVAWYHHKLSNPPQDVATLVRSAESFAAGEYASALAQGSSLNPATRDDIARKLHGYIGISENYLRRANLRIEPEEFEKQLLGASYRIAGRYDARFVGVDISPNAQVPDYDPSYTYVASAFLSTFNDYVRTDLGYHTEAIYQPLHDLGDWDLKRRGQQGNLATGDVLPDLRLAMTTNPHLRIFSANGYYDMATPFFATQYLIEHTGLDPSLLGHVQYGFYSAGHMVYTNPSALAAFKADLGRWYDAVLSEGG